MAVTPFQLTEPFSMDSFNSRISEINTMFGGLGNEYVWEKKGGALIEKSMADLGLDAIYLFNNAPRGSSSTIQYADSVTVDNDGVVSLVNPVSITVGEIISNLNANVLKGKYYTTCSEYGGTAGVFRSPSDDSFEVFQNGNNYIAWSHKNSGGKSVKVEGSVKLYGYVNSPDPNAYPPAVSDGYTYTPLGQLGEKVQIATGSYTGTGTFGSSNPNSLTFDFEPKLLAISNNTGPILVSSNNWTKIAFPEYFPTEFTQKNGFGYQLFNNGYGRKTNGGKTIEWYNTDSASSQLNGKNDTHYYMAIG